MKCIIRGLLCCALIAMSACEPRIASEDLPALPDVDVSAYLDTVARQVKAAQAVVAANPTSANANGELGMLYRVYRDFEAAEVAFRRARLLEPRNRDWLYYHSEVLEQLADHAGAETATRAMLRAEPDYAPARLRLGHLLGKTGELDEAAQVLRALIDDEPEYASAYIALASIEERRGHLNESADLWETSLRLAGDFGRGHYALSQLYRRLGRNDDAEKHRRLFAVYKARPEPVRDPRMTTMMRLNQSDKPIVRAAQYAKARGDDERALALLETAIERNPANLETRAALVSGYTAGRQFERAEAHYRLGVEVNAGHGELALSFSRLLIAEGRLAEAAVALTEITQRIPQSTRAWAWLGHVRQLRGDNDGAGGAYRKAIETDPADPTARRFYSSWLKRYADAGIAMAELTRLAGIDSGDNAQLLAELAALQAASGDRDAALESIHEAVEIAGHLGEKRQQAELRNQQYRLERGLTKGDRP